jgi:hypothetical protein
MLIRGIGPLLPPQMESSGLVGVPHLPLVVTPRRPVPARGSSLWVLGAVRGVLSRVDGDAEFDAYGGGARRWFEIGGVRI